jgi:hypothetical protein
MTAARPKNDLHTWGSGLPDEFLLCRDIGHTWRPFRATINPDGTYYCVMRCGRCRTERHRTLSHRGAILTNHYDYAEGYLAPAGTERMTTAGRDVLRLESVTRLLGHDHIDHGETN